MTVRGFIIGVTLSAVMSSCADKGLQYDATGMFEAVEIVVSAETQGKILSLNIEEGQKLNQGVEVGLIDTLQLYYNLLKAERGVNAMENKKSDIALQIAATRAQIANAKIEKGRAEKLLAAGAGGQQQLDNATTQLKVLESQLAAQLSSLGRGNQNVSDEVLSQLAGVEQMRDQISKSIIRSPVNGTVLVKYAEATEYAVPGKALFSIANIDTLNLRAYVSSGQLSELKLGQKAKVYADYGTKNNKEYDGTLIWISDQAEFTPKTIQTRDERANLVYAVKIAVPNDGLLKMGMYGEVNFVK